MTKINVKELMEFGFPMPGVIRYGEIGEECTSYADVWFIDDDAVIAEPYAINEKGERWFYNREIEFSIIDIIDLLNDEYNVGNEGWEPCKHDWEPIWAEGNPGNI